MGHGNGGWVEGVGSGVESVKKGDPVICHPLLSKGNTLAARRGNDMHAGGAFPGIDSNGGFAGLLHTRERALVKQPPPPAPHNGGAPPRAGPAPRSPAHKASAPPPRPGPVRRGNYRGRPL